MSDCCDSGWILTEVQREEEVFLGVLEPRGSAIGEAGGKTEIVHPITGKRVKWTGPGPEWRIKDQHRANPELYEVRKVTHEVATPCPIHKPFEYERFKDNNLTQGYLFGRPKAVSKTHEAEARERYGASPE